MSYCPHLVSQLHETTAKELTGGSAKLTRPLYKCSIDTIDGITYNFIYVFDSGKEIRSLEELTPDKIGYYASKSASYVIENVLDRGSLQVGGYIHVYTVVLSYSLFNYEVGRMSYVYTYTEEIHKDYSLVIKHSEPLVCNDHYNKASPLLKSFSIKPFGALKDKLATLQAEESIE